MSIDQSILLRHCTLHLLTYVCTSIHHLHILSIVLCHILYSTRHTGVWFSFCVLASSVAANVQYDLLCRTYICVYICGWCFVTWSVVWLQAVKRGVYDCMYDCVACVQWHGVGGCQLLLCVIYAQAIDHITTGVEEITGHIGTNTLKVRISFNSQVYVHWGYSQQMTYSFHIWIYSTYNN